MIGPLILHATPFAVQWKFPTSPLQQSDKQPRPKSCQDTTRGLKTQPNRSQAVPICDPHTRNKTLLCVISINHLIQSQKTANKPSHLISFIFAFC